MSGNGSRCAAAYLFTARRGLRTNCDFKRAPESSATTCANVGRRRISIEAEIGKPLFESASVPMQTAQPLGRLRVTRFPWMRVKASPLPP